MSNTEPTASELLRTTIDLVGLPEFMTASSQSSLARTIASVTTASTTQGEPHRLSRFGVLYEYQALEAYRQWIEREEDGDLRLARAYFALAYDCWRALSTLTDQGPTARAAVSPEGLSIFTREMPDEPLEGETGLAFRLAIAGLASQRSSDVRLDLTRFQLPAARTDTWRERVLDDVFVALVLLVRKQGGWSDIDLALARIDALRGSQQEFEAAYLDSTGDPNQQATAAIELVGLYHLAQMVTLAATYLRDGDTPGSNLRVRLDRHHDRALTALSSGSWPLLPHMVDLTWVCCQELIANSIWTHVGGLGDSARRLAGILASRGRPNPVIELWPSQQEALKRNLLDPYPQAILVEMPTSAGKTLLAKFAIVQTLALNPNSTVAYLVPTRALVNQVTVDLRSDLHELGFRVEQTVPAYELDPVEDQLLTVPPNVLVTTPEKFDLLLRRNHVATANLSMVVVDEAHNLRESTRGARLELVLGTVKRDRPGARFLLLSPFLPNNDELLTWLGEARSLPPIAVDWKPGRKIVGAVRSVGRGQNRHLELETLPAADNSELPEHLSIPLGPPAEATTIAAISRATVESSLERGSVLILCRGPGTATTRAKELAERLPIRPSSNRREAVSRYLDAELGRTSSLSTCLRHGVAYHHSGLSSEARWFVEGLIRTGDVDVVCGTTTLAQGVNFPITTVIIETLTKGDQSLTYSDFWNIAGRAGRALVDTVGVVAFPAPSQSKYDEYVLFLQGEAEAISSQLTGLINRADELVGNFNLASLRSAPELSSLLQFLAHAMRVGGQGELADEVEDLLRASLVYHQARRESVGRADALVRLCRSYLSAIRGTNPGILTLADHTGFATPSVLWLLGRSSEMTGLSDAEAWQPETMFGPNLDPLTQCVETIGGLPEIQLSEGRGRPFNAERIARILRDWVQGESLRTLANRYGTSVDQDEETRVSEFTRYLYSSLLTQTSWGLGALETVCLGTDQNQLGQAAYLPSMIYFGVKHPESVWLRTVGVPRIVADGIAEHWRTTVGGTPESYDHLRSWIGDLPDNAWNQAIPSGTELTPSDLRLLWSDLSG